ncbi:hypothetical protein D9M69_359920 [compost metagenome]
MLAVQGLALEAVGGEQGEVVRLEHAAEADVAAGLTAGGRAEHAQAAAGEQLEVGLGGRVAPHRLVHRRGEGDHGVGGQHQGGQQVVGLALGEACQQVGGGRGDQHQVGPARQLDVAHGGFGGGVEQVEVYRVAGQCLQGQRGDELAAALGHYHAHFGALVAQPANQFGALVGGDAAADAQDDAFPIQPLHSTALYRVGREWTRTLPALAGRRAKKERLR